MASHSAWPALPRLRLYRDWLPNARPRRPDLAGDAMHPGTQFLGVLDPVPRAVAAE
jgi:hypothetical protein